MLDVRRTAAAFVMMTLVLIGGCGREESIETVDTSVPETEDVATMPEPQPIEGTTDLEIRETDQPSLLESATLSRAGDDRSGDQEQFRIGDQIQLTVRVREVPEMLAAWVHWLGPDDQKIGEEQKPVPEDAVVTFDLDTTDLPAGVYSAEVYIGGDLTYEKDFRLSSPGAAEEN